VLPFYGLLGILLVRFLIQLAFNNWYAMFLSLKLLNWRWTNYLIDVPKLGIQYSISKAKEFNPARLLKK
jgi:hypothetical protein